MELFDFFLVLDVVIYSCLLCGCTVFLFGRYRCHLDAFFKLKNVYLNRVSFVSLICLHHAAYVYFFTSPRNNVTSSSVEDANFIFFSILLI